MNPIQTYAARVFKACGWLRCCASDENLGFMFATGQMNNGVKLANVQLRIGGPRETDVAGCPLGDLKCMRRALGAYMSQRDLQQMGASLSL